jgi:hypothetical protein
MMMPCSRSGDVTWFSDSVADFNIPFTAGLISVLLQVVVLGAYRMLQHLTRMCFLYISSSQESLATHYIRTS